MNAADLNYENLTANILAGHMFEGRTESTAFLAWFLEHILRLDDVASADAICDGPGDRGIDSIVVDHDNNEIVFLQSKVRQNENRHVGDQPIRDFAGSVAQFVTDETVRSAIVAEPNSELSKLFVRAEVAERIAEGYTSRGYFVTNSLVNDSGLRAAEDLLITIFSRVEIAERYVTALRPMRIVADSNGAGDRSRTGTSAFGVVRAAFDINAPDRVEGLARFDVSDHGYLEFSAGGAAKLYFDVEEPWSCHQIYKVFDEKYSEIFGRKIVSAWRIILLFKIMSRVEVALGDIGNQAIQRYRLTRYFLMYAISKIIAEDDQAKQVFEDPRGLLEDEDRCERVLDVIESIAKRLCVDLRFELVEDDNAADYKAVLKSSAQVPKMELKLRRSFLHDVARGREEMPSQAF